MFYFTNPTILRSVFDICIASLVASVLSLTLVSALRGFSSSTKSLVLAVSFGVILLLPVLSILAPTTISFPQSALSPRLVSYLPARPSVVNVDRHPDHSLHARANSTLNIVQHQRPDPVSQVPFVIVAVWIAGAMACAVKLLMSEMLARRILSRTSRIPSETLREHVPLVASRIRLGRSVKLWVSDEPIPPLTRGVFLPILLLPASAESWSSQRLDAVIGHELAHIARHDRLTQIISELTCMMYWFNPLIWFLSHRLTSECERACDDRVLGGGMKAHEYAGHLIAVLTEFRGRMFPESAALAIAGGSSQIAGRVRSILSPSQRRGTSRLSPVWASSLALAVLLPMSMLRPSTLLADQTGASASSASSSRGSKDAPHTRPSANARRVTVVFNGERMTLVLDGTSLTLHGTRVDLSVQRSDDRVTVSSGHGGTSVTLANHGTGMIKGNGMDLSIRMEGSQTDVAGMGLHLVLTGDVFVIQDHDGLEVRAEHARIIVSDPSRVIDTPG